jgi:phosphoribosylanthranilate isomerase
MSVAPAGVDAHSGLEDSRGRKDPEKVREFVREALRAEQDLTRMENR